MIEGMICPQCVSSNRARIRKSGEGKFHRLQSTIRLADEQRVWIANIIRSEVCIAETLNEFNDHEQYFNKNFAGIHNRANQTKKTVLGYSLKNTL